MNYRMKKTARKNARSPKGRSALRASVAQRRTLGFEPLEERLTLSTTASGFENSHAPTQSTSTSDVVSLAASTQGSLTVAYLFNADGTTSYFSPSDAAQSDGQGDHYFDTDDTIIIVPADAIFSGTNGLGNGGIADDSGGTDSNLNPFRTIPAPEIFPGNNPAGGTIALTEVFHSVARTYASTMPQTVSGTPTRVFTLTNSSSSIELGNPNATGVSASDVATSQALPAAQGRDIAFEVAYAVPGESMNGTHEQVEIAPTSLLSAAFQEASLAMPDSSNTISTAPLHLDTNALSEPTEPTKLANHRAESPLQESLLTVESSSRNQLAHPFATLANLEAADMNSRDSVFTTWHDKLSLAAPIGENERFLGTWEIAVALVFGGVFLMDQREKMGEKRLETEQKPPHDK